MLARIKEVIDIYLRIWQSVLDLQEITMTNHEIGLKKQLVYGLAILLVAIAAIWAYTTWIESVTRGQALTDALQYLIDANASEPETGKAKVAEAIKSSYLEVRANARRWSSVYWGCTFAAAIFSALAGLILKFESLKIDEKWSRDIAAALAVSAAILVTISTSGDFQRKWQANRIAAAEIEHAGYVFLERDGANPRSFYAEVGKIQLRRHMAIVGESDVDSFSLRGQNEPE